jgi:hypothetical protein
MAYDLSSFYTNTLSSNYLSKTIVDQLMADKRFSSVSKIVLNDSNYSSGSAHNDPIGYTETGRPIYESNVGITMNDELKDAIAKKHARNTDSMLKNIGTNIIENTSTGNIVAFVSKGVIQSFITEDGRFTGKIRLENIEDLNKLTLDTSRFYIKSEVDSLLSAKLSRASIFNENNKIDSDFLDSDVVRHVTFDPHFNDDIRHITNAERQAWNLKYDKPTAGIPMADLDPAVSDRINASALNTEFQTHKNNLDIHTSATERAKWNAKYNKPATGIPMTDFSEIVQNNINSAAKQTELTAHKDDVIKHITAEERIKWNAKYDRPTGGIPMGDLEQFVQETIEAAATDADLSAHKNDTVAHITNAERLGWNAKYLKPSTGIPLTDLDSATQTKINTSATVSQLDAHVSNTTSHITASERDAWNEHKADLVKHITGDERNKWNAKYDRPSTGIPETDLTAGLQTKINGMVTNTDFNQHATDSVRHVTQSERDDWDAKYEKPLTGIPSTDLHSDVVNKINNAATQTALDTHVNNTVNHILGTERTAWNAKYDKPVGGIPETDLTVAFRDKVASLATTLALTTHSNDVVKHITAAERNTWNAKYVKPTTGIPAADLEVALKDKINASATSAEVTAHTSDTVVHITAAERASWNAHYTKPSTGIPETDLEQAFRTKVNGMVSSVDFNAHATDSTKHVTASERANWNAKYVKPSTGIPLTDFATAVQDAINGAATVVALDAHKADSIAHVTSADRSVWNAKYDKPAEGIPATDLEVAVTDDIASAVGHIADTNSHVSSADRTVWNAKYDKPSTGIPASDLASAITTDISSAKTHVADANIHVTSEQKTAWDGKYAKPVAGIPLADLVIELQNKLNAVAVPYTKTIDATAPVTTVSILASEHGVTKTNAFEYSVVAYTQNGEFWETVNPSLVRVNDATKDVEVQFAVAFAGKIVIR